MRRGVFLQRDTGVFRPATDENGRHHLFGCHLERARRVEGPAVRLLPGWEADTLNELCSCDAQSEEFTALHSLLSIHCQFTTAWRSLPVL